jgi:hypothetical protein
LVEQAQEEEKSKRRKGSQLNSLPGGKPRLSRFTGGGCFF